MLKKTFYWRLSGFFLSFLICFFDFFTKNWAVEVLLPYQPHRVFSYLNWTLAFNTGSAFSFLAHTGEWHRWFLGGLNFIISLFIVRMLCRMPTQRHFEFYGLSLILGGAIGNLSDRIRYGFVIDFIDVFYYKWHWPVFNIADVAICMGGFFLLMSAFKEGAKASKGS